MRYSRQEGLVDQKRLARSTAAVMGMGGLGCFVATELALAGVGHIYIVDRDRIEESNLNRQFLYTEGDIGRYKVEVAAERLSRLNPHIRITPVKGDARNLDIRTDLVFDCLDSWEHKQTLWKNYRPIVFGSVGGWIGMVGVFVNKIPKFVAKPADGVLGACAGVVGSIMATEGIRELSGSRSTLRDRILHMDMRRMEFTILEF